MSIICDKYLEAYETDSVDDCVRRPAFFLGRHCGLGVSRTEGEGVMADITKCTGENCPLKDRCYRFTAKADEYRQAYFGAPPIKEGKCEYFWEVGKRSNADK